MKPVKIDESAKSKWSIKQVDRVVNTQRLSSLEYFYYSLTARDMVLS